MSLKVEVTRAAQDQVRQLIQGQKPGTVVRVFVQPGGSGGGGGCCGEGAGGCGCGSGGPAFGLSFDRTRSGDEVIPVDGFSVVVDSLSASELDGAKIDFVENLDTSGFTIIPAHVPTAMPSAGGGCACGAGGCGAH